MKLSSTCSKYALGSWHILEDSGFYLPSAKSNLDSKTYRIGKGVVLYT